MWFGAQRFSNPDPLRAALYKDPREPFRVCLTPPPQQKEEPQCPNDSTRLTGMSFTQKRGRVMTRVRICA